MTLDVLLETKKVRGVYDIDPLEDFDYTQHDQLNFELEASTGLYQNRDLSLQL